MLTLFRGKPIFHQGRQLAPSEGIEAMQLGVEPTDTFNILYQDMMNALRVTVFRVLSLLLVMVVLTVRASILRRTVDQGDDIDGTSFVIV